MDQRSPELRWGVERRLEFIEFRLYWEGGINRSDIIEKFGVSVPQASKDLSQYQQAAPGNIEYDKSEKRYFVSANFEPVFFKPDADRYLNQLKSIADNIASADETWLSNIPQIDSMPIPHRRVDVDVLRRVAEAVSQNRSLEIYYQSMSDERPEPIWRWISPHAFGNDGFRWHVRAFCHIDKKFKDFVLSRTLDTRGENEPVSSPENDQFWKEFTDVILVPNPKLTSSQRKFIAMDYDMQEERLIVPIRKALLYYFKKRLRLDIAEVLDRPQEAPVIVENRDEFEAALKEASS